MKPIIRVENLGKQYRIGEKQPQYGNLRESITRAIKKPFKRTKSGDESNKTIWALKDLSFEVFPGEVVGIIGRNGAGKSTLLKILSRITDPTTGEVDLYGRVGSLLEVGTGFHMELTGRENIYLNGAILGMSRSEIRRRYDEMVDFAGVEKFLDTPVKHYSSGMFMRLAFSVAAHLDPEILVIDEVLAVGDVEFQKKCLGKMGEAAKHGRTVLFVSHSMQALSSFCSVGLLLNQGCIVDTGPIASIVKRYMGEIESSAAVRWVGNEGGDEFRLRKTEALGGQGDLFTTDQEIKIRIVGEVMSPLLGLVCGVEIWSVNQFLAYSAHDDALPPPITEVSPGPFEWELTIPPNTFAEGAYEIKFDLGLHHKNRLVDQTVGGLKLNVVNTSGIGRRFSGSWTNMFRPGWKWNRITTESRGDEKMNSGQVI